MNREAAYSALFALVSAVPGLVTTSRKLLHWDDVQPTQMPALFMAQGGQIAKPVTGRPTVWELNAALWIYVSTEGSDNPGSVLNPLVDAITALLANPIAGFPQTLGGIVQWARVEGECVTSEGTLGQIEVIKIPVKMLTTG